MVRAIALVGMLATGCVSTTVIRTKPSRATVTLDGEVVGRTPYTVKSSDSSFAPPKVFTLEKAGYEPATVSLAKTEWGAKTAVVAIVGLFALWPIWITLPWTADYPQVPVVELDPIETEAPEPAAPPPRRKPPPEVEQDDADQEEEKPAPKPKPAPQPKAAPKSEPAMNFDNLPLDESP